MNKLNFHLLEPLRFPLVNRLYKEFYPAGKAKKDEVIWIGDNDKGLICSVRFKQFDSLQLLTGMLVHPEYRRQGLAQQLLTASNKQIRNKDCYCFAFRELVSLYTATGFKIVAIEDLPNTLSSRLIRYASRGKDLVPMYYQP